MGNINTNAKETAVNQDASKSEPVKNPIKVPITVYNDGALKKTFKITISYQLTTTIENLLNAATDEMDRHIYPKSCKIKTITKNSFVTNGIHLHSWSTEYEKIGSKSLTKYNKNNIKTMGLSICVVFDRKYEHKVNQNFITCKYLKDNTDPSNCSIYNDLKIRTALTTQDKLNHLNEFTHFHDELVEKAQCKYGQQCYAFIRLKNGGNALHDRVHIKLYAHAIRSNRQICQIKFDDENVCSLVVNKNSKQNYPLYKPTHHDDKKYSYTNKDGYLNALIGEVSNNGFKSDLCIMCNAYDNDCKHEEFTLLKIVNEKFNHIRHKQMGRPLRKDHILSLLLYTGCDCNYDLCKSQRNGNYEKWKWFDLILNEAISKLCKQESASYEVYSGLTNVKMNVPYVDEGFFPTYVSTSWTKEVAKAFMGSNTGMIMQFDAKFRKNSVCCDASWFSKFPDECEILFSRSVPNSVGFQAEILDEDPDGIQIVKMTHSSAQIKRYQKVLMDSYEKLRKNKSKHFTDTQINILPAQIMFLNKITIPVHIQCIADSNDSKYNAKFNVSAAYSEQYTLQHLVDQSILEQQKSFNPVKFELHSIDNVFGTNDKMELSQLLQCPLTKYTKNNIICNGLHLIVIVKIYHHKVLKQNQIECPAMIEANTDDPTYCTIYAKMRYQYLFTSEHLTHMKRYNHFDID
eukprot:332875_1